MKHTFKLALSASFLVLMGLQACSSEDPVAPSRPPIPVPNPTVDGGVEPGTDGGPGGSDCFDTTKTKPVEPAHFLNQCNSTECFKFDNARIEGFTPGGQLPPLN